MTEQEIGQMISPEIKMLNKAFLDIEIAMNSIKEKDAALQKEIEKDIKKIVKSTLPEWLK